MVLGALGCMNNGAETWKFNKNLESKLMSMEMDFLGRSARCFRSVKLVWPRAKDGQRAPQKNFRMVPTWKTKKEKTSEYVYAEGYNKIERAGNWRFGMGQQRRVEKEN